MNQKRILIWYRRDLRLHDHEPMYQALQQKAQVIPLYCFDERQFTTTSFGFPKTGAFRAQFLLESVAELRNSLRQLGSKRLLNFQICLLTSARQWKKNLQLLPLFQPLKNCPPCPS